MVGAAHSSGGLNRLGASFWSRAERLRVGTLDGNATALAFREPFRLAAAVL